MWDRQPSSQLKWLQEGPLVFTLGSASKKISDPEVVLITGVGQSCLLGKLSKLTFFNSFSFVIKIQVAQHLVPGDSGMTAWVSGDTEGMSES